jgi:hypothetical protein
MKKTNQFRGVIHYQNNVVCDFETINTLQAIAK